MVAEGTSPDWWHLCIYMLVGKRGRHSDFNVCCHLWLLLDCVLFTVASTTIAATTMHGNNNTFTIDSETSSTRHQLARQAAHKQASTIKQWSCSAQHIHTCPQSVFAHVLLYICSNLHSKGHLLYVYMLSICKCAIRKQYSKISICLLAFFCVVFPFVYVLYVSIYLFKCPLLNS